LIFRKKIKDYRKKKEQRTKKKEQRLKIKTGKEFKFLSSF